jgi:hypothetical protein
MDQRLSFHVRIPLVVTVVLLAACTQGVTDDDPEPAIVYVSLEMDGGACKAEVVSGEGSPATPTLSADQRLYWVITNYCDELEGNRPRLVRFVVVKNEPPQSAPDPGDDPYPGARGGQTQPVRRHMTETLRVRINPDRGNAPQGKNKYTYTIDVEPGTMADPEIIVDWP